MMVAGGGGDWPVSPSQAVLFADEIVAVRAVLGDAFPEARVIAALSRCGANTQRTINALLDDSTHADDDDPKNASVKVDPNGGRRALALVPVKVKAEAPEESVGSQESVGSSAKAAKVKSERFDLPHKVPSLMPHRAKVEKSAAAAAAGGGISLVPRPKKRPREDEAESIYLTATHPVPYLNARPIRALPPKEVADVKMRDPPRPKAIAPAPARELRMVVAPPEAEFGDFPVEPDWFLVGKSYVNGLSTNQGRRIMDAGEIVHFSFPSYGMSYGGLKVSAKKKAALAEIVRFSTKRAGEIGKLSPDWANCLVPLVNSSKVKIQGKIVFPAMELRLMQDVLLYVSFYIHSSVFTEGEVSSWNTGGPVTVDFAANPLHQLFTLLKLKASNKDDFSLDELSTKKLKRILWGNRNCGDKSTPILGQTFPEQGTDEQAISEAALNKIVGTAETFDLEILADAMGLGKTVMTIALILSDPRGKHSRNTERDTRDPRDRAARAQASRPSDELEAHSTQGALSVFVHYGGDKTDNLMLMAQHDVVLTTYGVLSAAYKNGYSSIFHMMGWYRIVLDEAHTIKSPKAKVAQAAFELTSQCRWCLTGTPLQNDLEDLYSLLCFLHVEPWCNATWWQRLIQKPYEIGDDRGLKLVRAILRPLMLRRTKETKDKIGKPILVLPPAQVEVVECEQSEDERDFYEALFRRSKVQFDKFVAQGSVLNNYANILELLLRLRQCCNHPFLVISRADTQKYADLDKLAQRFLEGVQSDSRAYVEEVVEEIRQGATTECPICLESASDDPVITPCAHRMCRECLISCWTTPDEGPCPLCRSHISRSDLIILPAQCRFQVDPQNNWKDSCKVTKLITILEELLKKGEKSIVFSQFTSFFDLLEVPFSHKGIKFLRFDGKLSQKHKENVLKEFSESQDKLVLLMSLKAGGVGLNLTAASNVFLMDPWWNPAVEEQAIMRIHRIGQKRAVQVRRFIVKDTVEERMQQVQIRKQRMISGALTDQEVRGARIEHLKMLFT
ncbi:hypothetical protein PR202_ga30401 [Eleusine coracana subsp. coracana]|uniref:SWI/SNF-related matrix-associated actin-dependent regulator of chromatin subfamily A member 3-like 3 n=1 Tax=Eleusine coracana subsp. coracana TaxID=191504 RepID=A0AAV5DPL2_ELECO|nr:hypothetical protein PR202_ga30401 [Eleusine coracana subsp. coracana]